MPYPSVGADEVERRPCLVVERPPDPEVVVDRDGMGDAERGDRLAHVGEVFLEGELGRVHADDHEPAILVSLCPGSDVRQHAQAVDAGIGPEIHQNDLAAQVLGVKRRCIQPLPSARQRGRRAGERQRRGGRRRRARGNGGLVTQAGDEAVLETVRAGGGPAGQQAGIEPEPDDRGAGHHGRAEDAANSLAPPHRPLGGGQQASAEEHAGGERGRRAQRIGQEQQRRLDAGPTQRRAGSGSVPAPGRHKVPRPARSPCRAASRRGPSCPVPSCAARPSPTAWIRATRAAPTRAPRAWGGAWPARTASSAPGRRSCRARSPPPAQPPATDARLATAAKANASPSSVGRPPRMNGWSARASTNGRIGKMHGVAMVRTPAR